MTATTAPRHLWQEAATLLRQIFALFGEPQSIAHQHTLTRKAHALLSSWIRGAEALLRQLLLIEAAALPGPPVPRRQTSADKAQTVREKRFITHDPDHPESWRVSFRVFDGGAAWLRQAQPSGVLQTKKSARLSLSKAARAERNTAERRFFSAWPLAERAEALLRVFNNPAPYAKRLARKLFARPERAQHLVMSENAHHGIIPEEVIEQARAPTESALHRFPNSS